jgi:hypothetical protein
MRRARRLAAATHRALRLRQARRELDLARFRPLGQRALFVFFE